VKLHPVISNLHPYIFLYSTKEERINLYSISLESFDQTFTSIIPSTIISIFFLSKFSDAQHLPVCMSCMSFPLHVTKLAAPAPAKDCPFAVLLPTPNARPAKPPTGICASLRGHPRHT
jgi:hypothetical protein